MKKIFVLFVLFCVYSTGFSQTQIEMTMEAGENYKKADKEMTAAYKKTLKGITDPAQKQLFIQAQREWIKYKEAHCKAVASQYEGGSAQPMVLSNCLAELTKERTEKLKNFFNY